MKVKASSAVRSPFSLIIAWVPVAMRASGIWLEKFTAAQMKLQSPFCCQYRVEELGHPAQPGSLGNSQESSRPKCLQEADTCLAGLGEESLLPPGWPWLGILLVTQCCGMTSVPLVSRGSLQQKPSDEWLKRGLLASKMCKVARHLAADPLAPH